MNMKRIIRLEKIYQDLFKQNLNNKCLLELIRNVQIKDNNSDDNFSNIDFYKDVFQTDIEDLNNIYLENTNIVNNKEEIIIPTDFY